MSYRITSYYIILFLLYCTVLYCAILYYILLLDGHKKLALITDARALSTSWASAASVPAPIPLQLIVRSYGIALTLVFFSCCTGAECGEGDRWSYTLQKDGDNKPANKAWYRVCGLTVCDMRRISRPKAAFNRYREYVQRVEGCVIIYLFVKCANSWSHQHACIVNNDRDKDVFAILCSGDKVGHTQVLRRHSPVAYAMWILVTHWNVGGPDVPLGRFMLCPFWRSPESFTQPMFALPSDLMQAFAVSQAVHFTFCISSCCNLKL